MFALGVLKTAPEKLETDQQATFATLPEVFNEGRTLHSIASNPEYAKS